jgi:hypothetical protein
MERTVGSAGKVLLLGTMLAFASVILTCSAQNSPQAPIDLVRETVKTEIASASDCPHFMFLERKQTPNGSQTRLVVETSQATAGMLVALNDKPLSPEQRHAEDLRLRDLMDNPDELRKKMRSEKEDAERTERIVRALPDAFLYEADGTEIGKPGLGKEGEELVRLKFRPNPGYHPPSHIEQVLTGMQGQLLIDARDHRIARIDGTLIREVGFGWDILGHLDKGGRFLVEQAYAGDGGWEVTRMSLSFTGRILLFKSINIRSDDAFSEFRLVPSGLTFAAGVQLLKKHEAELAENR